MPKPLALSFVTEIPLRVSRGQERQLLVRFDAARQVYNACLGEGLRRLRLMRQSKAYQAARKMRKGTVRNKAFRALRSEHGFHEYDLHSYAKQFNHCWLGDGLDINTIQKLATRSFKALEQYAYGKRGKPRFKGKNQLDSVEGKSNVAGIRWREDRVLWLGLEMPGRINPRDEVIQHGLKSRTKYVRLVRRKLNGKSRFFAQLICEGLPYQKPKNKLGSGRVGLDLGPSTIAVVSDEKVKLMAFAEEVEERKPEIRRLQRKLDRQRRANNPENFSEDGTIKQGPKRWVKSARQQRTQSKLAEMQRIQAATRKSSHGRLANEILALGDQINFEKLSYRSFQKNWGKSAKRRAPGMFVEILKRKAESAGASAHEFPTYITRFSQTCHGCGTIKKKGLNVRWHRCECGVTGQRDVYSAFLAMCLDADTNQLNAGLAEELWPSVDARMQVALSDLKKSAIGGHLPASFGLGRRPSGSLANSTPILDETSDVVPGVYARYSGELMGVQDSGRTPRL